MIVEELEGGYPIIATFSKRYLENRRFSASRICLSMNLAPKFDIAIATECCRTASTTVATVFTAAG